MPSHNYFTSSIGKKQITALTGLGLLGFTAAHLAGNLLVLLGADTFNAYSHELVSHPLILFAQVGLAALFLAHIFTAIFVTVQNAQARSKRYYIKTRSGRGETIASMTMPITGVILLVFIILHLLNFKFGTEYQTTVDGVVMRDIFRTVVEYFANPFYVAWYVFAMLALGLHTGHGLQSSAQTWGLNHPKYTPVIKFASVAYGATVAVGFSAISIYCHFLN
ncbi:MAG: succinate dehydrogenase cytochrome b subunit [Bacteriovoracaceae bacterium]